MKTRSWSGALGASLFLVAQNLTAAPAKSVVQNHAADIVAIMDVSGSMYHDLPAFKRDLSNLLPRLLQPGDTFSLIFFSGPGQTGTILDTVQIRAGGERLIDIAQIQRDIASMETIGLTCFTDPLVLAAGLGARLKKDRPAARRTLIMGTDGYDNMSPSRKAILDALTQAAGNFDRVVTMGVGWCCDQGILQQMAATVGGQFFFARDIGSFSRDFEAAASKRPAGAKRSVVKIEGAPLDGLVFATTGSEITQYEVVDGEISLPEGTERVWYVAEAAVGEKGDLRRIAKDVATGQGAIPLEAAALEAAYAALVLYAQRSRRKVAREIATAIGDARLLNLTLGAFGPQRYADVAEEAGKAFAECRDGAGIFRAVRAGATAYRFTEGYTVGVAIDPHAFTVIDALRALERGDNRIVPDHESFKYTPITRSRVNAGGVVTPTDVAKLAEVVSESEVVSAKLGEALKAVAAGAPVEQLDGAAETLTATAAKLADMATTVRALRAAKNPEAKYTYDPAPDGYPVDGLVFGSTEANVSIRLVRAITVDLTPALAALPEALREKVPTTFSTFKYASYTVITGRVLSLAVVPCILDEATWAVFVRAGLVSGTYRAEVVAVDLRSLPLINDAMIAELSAKKTVAEAFELASINAAAKVRDDFSDAYVPKAESSAVGLWVATTGIDGAEAEQVKAWLKSIGITDGGYAPRSAAGEKKDKRRSWKLKVSIPGLSGSTPPVAKVLEKLAKIAAWKKTQKGKEPTLTLGESLVAPELEAVHAFLAKEGLDVAKLLPPAADKPETPAQRAAREAGIAKLSAGLSARGSGPAARRRQILANLGQTAIIAITGGEWFSDLKPGEKVVEISGPTGKLPVEIDVVDVDIDI